MLQFSPLFRSMHHHKYYEADRLFYYICSEIYEILFEKKKEFNKIIPMENPICAQILSF